MSSIGPSAAAGAAPVSLTPAPKSEREKLKGVSQQFEAIFVRQMLSAARKTDLGGGLFDSEALGTFREMQDNQYADVMAKAGTLGLGKMIESHLAKQLNLPAVGKK